MLPLGGSSTASHQILCTTQQSSAHSILCGKGNLNQSVSLYSQVFTKTPMHAPIPCKNISNCCCCESGRPDIYRKHGFQIPGSFMTFLCTQAVRSSTYGRPGATYLDIPNDFILGSAPESEVRSDCWFHLPIFPHLNFECIFKTRMYLTLLEIQLLW